MNRVLRGLLALSLVSSFVAYGAETAKSWNNCCTNGSDCNSCCDCDKCCLGPCDGYPFLQQRSQGRNSARQLVGEQQFINQYDMDCTYGTFSVALEYSKTFRNERIANFLFGKDLVNCCELYVQGSQVPNRHANAWVADYFGLPTDYSSKVRFCPKVQNVIIDLNFFLGLDEVTEGLYLKINAPLVWTKWELNPCENRINEGSNAFAAGYMSQTEIPRASLPSSFLEASNGGVTWGDMKTPIQYGRISTCDLTKTRIAEIDFTLGWNFVLEEDYHFGAFLYVAAPTGNRPCGKYLFEPMVGNGKHWELGGGLSGSWTFWQNEECEDRYWGLWLDATIAHLFKANQCRSFDFCCKPNSRYMLLQEMTKADGNLTGEADAYTPVNNQYATNLIPAINWSTFNVDVKINVQADVALKLGYVRENWNFDLGYNLYARTGEKFCCNDCEDCCCDSSCQSASSKTYAAKGCLPVYGRWIPEGDQIIPLGNTASNATISCCGDTDNSEQAFYTSEHRDVFLIPTTDYATSSVQPVLVSRNMLNLGKSPSSITHKVFGHISYAWKDRDEDWIPFLGIGGEVEFAQNTDCCNDCNYNCAPCSTTGTTHTSSTTNCNACCNNCKDDCCTRRGGLSIWGLWIKGGISFN